MAWLCENSKAWSGRPWARPLGGVLDQLVVESDALAGNPLGDPARRPLYVYRPPGVELDHPKRPAVGVRDPGVHRPGRHVALALGARAQHDRARRRDVRRAGVPGRDRGVRRRWTSRGGSQFINSASTGRYLDYLCDEVVPFIDGRYPTLAVARPSRADRQVVRRLRRDGRADAPAGRVRGARLARRRCAVRVLLPARVPRRRRGAARQLRGLLRGLLRAARGRRPLRLRKVRRRRSRCTGTRPRTRPT